MSSKEFYVYLYLREKDGRFPAGTPYYVGKGTGNRVVCRHANDIKPPKNKSCVLVKECFSESEAFEMEEYLIQSYGRIDLHTGSLHNKTAGGDGDSGRVFTEQHCLNISEARKGFTRSAKSRLKQSESRKGKPWSEARRAHGNGRLGFKQSEETRRKISEANKKQWTSGIRRMTRWAGEAA